MKRIALVALVLFFACKKEEMLRAAPASDAVARGDTATSATATSVTTTSEPATSAPAQPVARMIVRNASLTLVVRDALDVLQKTTSLVESKGGFVADERQWKEQAQVRASATLRVPAAQLSAVLATIGSYGVRIESQSITSQDVSQEFTDLGAQLRNLQATEVELRELLKTVGERSKKASDVMDIYSEITKVRGQIEQIQGRMQYLSQTTALSTITLELVPDALAAPVVEPGWQPVETIRSAARSLINTLKTLADIAIWIILYLLPIALIFVVVALAIRAVWRGLRRRRGAKIKP